MQPILVTGGAGYIGSHTVRVLLDAGRDVVVVDNLSKGFRQSLPVDAPFEQVDTRDTEAMRVVLQRYKPSAVMHFAAFLAVEESVKDPLGYYDNNVVGTVHLLQAMQAEQVKHFIFSSTCAIFGQPERVPITENMPKLPESPYGQTKLAIEHMLPWLEQASDLRWCSLRYFNAAGAHESGKIGLAQTHPTQLIPRAILSLLRNETVPLNGTDWPTPDGTCIRDYIHVMDLADAHVKALEHLEAGGKSQAYNLGTGKGTSIRAVFEAIERVSGQKLRVEEHPRRPGDPAQVFADSTKAQTELGWKPHYPEIKEIVRSAWKWHSSHPNGYQISDNR